MQLQNRFFTKKDAINITPFLDIMLVLFVIIIVVASFNNYNSLKEQKKLEELAVKIKKLEKEKKLLQSLNQKLKGKLQTIEIKNKSLIVKNNVLIKKNSLLVKENKNIKNFLNQLTMKVIVYQDFLTINGVKYSFEDFKDLVKNGIIKKVQFYYSKDEKSFENYKRINEFLNKLGWDIKNLK